MKKIYGILAIFLVALFVFTACTPKQQNLVATVAPVEPTEVPPHSSTGCKRQKYLLPKYPAAPTEDPVCLIVGATYGGPIMDAGYNQAMHEAVAAIKENILVLKLSKQKMYMTKLVQHPPWKI